MAPSREPVEPRSGWQSNKIRAGQETFDQTRVGHIQPGRNSQWQQIHSKLHKVHSSSNPWSFLQKSLQDQKCWMTLFMRKPKYMSMQDYIACVIEINNYLKEFPPVIIGRECHQATRQRTTRLTRVWNPHQVATENAGSKL